MTQLDLKLAQKLVYTPEGFLDHEGSLPTRGAILSGIKESKWMIAFVYGEERSGKTHFAVRLSSDLEALGYEPLLISGQDISSPIFASKRSVVLVDDFEKFDPKKNSGSFVNFCEEMKNRSARIIFFSAAPPSSLPFDDHILSRLSSALRFEIGPPGERDTQELLKRLSLQRGVKLSGRKLGYATRRVRRDIASLERFVERVKAISRNSGSKIKFDTIAAAT